VAVARAAAARGTAMGLSSFASKPVEAIAAANPKTFFQLYWGAYREWMMPPPPSWEELHWLRRQWDGPFMLKGVMRVDDAIRAVDAGFSAISVSNHGGNNLDGTPGSIRALPAIAEAVGDEVEVLLDGGVRRGGDVVKALALGARAVMIGRAYLWGLAAAGQAGVENVFDILRAGIDSTLLGLGRRSVTELSQEDLIAPAGFERRLGAVDRDRALAAAHGG
jgi:pre-mycofactocin synthase